MKRFKGYREEHKYYADIVVEFASHISINKIVEMLCELEEFKYYNIKTYNLEKQEPSVDNPNYHIKFTLTSTHGEYFYIVLDAINECFNMLNNRCIFSIVTVNIKRGYIHDNRISKKESNTSGYN